MKCNAIVAITIADNLNDPELNYCAQALKDKYSTQTLFVQSKGTTKDFTEKPESFLLDINNLEELQTLSNKWIKDNNDTGVGLYFTTHGNYQTTSPPVEYIAAFFVNQLIKKGLAFRKINLCACFSAGNAKSLLENSPAKKFCNEVTKLVGTDEKLLLSLAGTMVVGYRSYITFHEQGKEEHPSKEERSDVSKRYFKTFSSDKSNIPPTHPSFKDAFVQNLVSVGNTANSKTDAKKLGVDVYKLTQKFTQTKDLAEYWHSIDGYVKQKWAWQFDEKSKDWKMISIAKFTDNQNISKMVTPCYFIRIALSSTFAEEAKGCFVLTLPS